MPGGTLGTLIKINVPKKNPHKQPFWDIRDIRDIKFILDSLNKKKDIYRGVGG